MYIQTMMANFESARRSDCIDVHAEMEYRDARGLNVDSDRTSNVSFLREERHVHERGSINLCMVQSKHL